MKKLIIALTFFPLFSHAIDLMPGTWEQTVEIDKNALMLVPEFKKLQEQFKNLPKEQSEMMMNMISSQMAPKKIQDCITKEMISKPENFIPKKDECTFKVKSNTDKEMVSEINCQGNVTGTVTLTVKSKKSYTGLFAGIDEQKNKINVKFSGELIKESCAK